MNRKRFWKHIYQNIWKVINLFPSSFCFSVFFCINNMTWKLEIRGKMFTKSGEYVH